MARGHPPSPRVITSMTVIGTSTDDADAVVLAWHKREEALRRQMRARLLNPGYGIRYTGPDRWMAS